MMHSRMLFGLFSFCSLTFATQAFSLTCLTGDYPMMCRGKMSIETRIKTGSSQSKDSFFSGRKHTSAAGTTGQYLREQGSCAWKDRAILATEPNRFYSRVTEGSMNYIWAGGEMNALACLRDGNCVVEFCSRMVAHPDGGNSFYADFINSVIYYPFG